MMHSFDMLIAMRQGIERYWPPRCLQCEYDLRGLAESRACPECGLPFHPATVVVDAWQYGEWPRLWNAPFFVLLFLSGMFLASLSLAAPRPYVRGFVLIIGLILIGRSARGLWNQYRRHRGRAPHQLVLYRRSIAVFKARQPLGRSLRWKDVQSSRLRAIPGGAWRLRVKVDGWSLVDVVIQAELRAMAKLRAEIKRRIRACRMDAQN